MTEIDKLQHEYDRLESQIEQCKKEQRKLVVGWWGIPKDGIDVDDRYGDGWPEKALGQCTGISDDGYFIVNGDHWCQFTPVVQILFQPASNRSVFTAKA